LCKGNIPISFYIKIFNIDIIQTLVFKCMSSVFAAPSNRNLHFNLNLLNEVFIARFPFLMLPRFVLGWKDPSLRFSTTHSLNMVDMLI